MNSSHPIAAADPRWFTSSYSNGSGGECVECARAGEGMLVRDSKRRGGRTVAVSSRAWRAFVGWSQDSQRSTAA
ncbi:DUF397 domain-containing protein [Streptomyces sp. CB03238]|uniref:DUF397 domain-containing protein n=1 Tax=Streptomyces sp. CB03238 TaxID=1907777 RepID=UPI000A118D93|nr:DUF397 domain-containing protein [Streptomyces sp. CB03238]ORT61577.1 hypothetical protein BKD26_00595 [Streptomyces sp. CB03238]